MTKNRKLLIAILVVGIILAGGWWIWNNYYRISETSETAYREELNKEISDKIEKLDKSCQFNEDCKTVELLSLIQANGTHPICVNKGEDIKEIRSLQDLYYKKYKSSLPNILIAPARFYGCECKQNVCTEITKKPQEVTITTDKTEYEQGEKITATLIYKDKIYQWDKYAWSIQKLEDNAWVTIQRRDDPYFFCANTSECKNEKSIEEIKECLPVVLCEMPMWYEIKDMPKLVWDQSYKFKEKNFSCEIPAHLGEAKRLDDRSCAIFDQIPAGKYKIRFEYAVSINPDDLFSREVDIRYTEKEFTIKEKTSEILTPDYVLKHSEELINKSISVEGTANNNKNKVICTKGPGCNKCDSPLILEESGQSIEISGRLINTIITCTGTDCEGIKECIPLTKGKFYVVKGIWNGKSLDIESWTEKTALDPRCGQRVKGTMVSGTKTCTEYREGYEFYSSVGKCIKKGASGCLFIIPFDTLEECQKVCEISVGEELPFETIENINWPGIGEKKNYVIKNKEDWQEVWANAGHSAIAPEIDFTKEMIIAAFYGVAATGGYNIEITKIIESADKLEVFVKETSPGKGCIVTQAATEPRHIIKLQKSDKEVIFKMESEVTACE